MGLYVLQLRKDLDVHPKYFGKNLKDYIHEKLVQETEGTCNGRYGYVVGVVQIIEISPGVIRQDGTGLATFTVRYSGLVCRPYKGEVIDCVVTSVNKMGFFAEAGPLQIFVSNHLIPEELVFDAQGDPCYQSSDGGTKIGEGSEVRARIVGTRMDQSDIFCIGTIKEDYLGLLGGPV
uniref:DNA-directed RNA polymerase II subunit RPB7 n=1 Tax=Chlamydomonas leiostraca TaxID=1034604 RepID=A0A7S0RKS2_9CHLO|mmetsp:Transcript_25131/g.63745  ORF Transcript_25131/g.63745 Transcript_25131/m.63745 type:complete len:177 (+) Transcript_25131:119-649(+)